MYSGLSPFYRLYGACSCERLVYSVTLDVIHISNTVSKGIVSGGVMDDSHASVSGFGGFLGDEPEPGS